MWKASSNSIMNDITDDSRALPAHVPLDIWEVYARLVLQSIDQITYSNLYHGDKPDLYDCDKDIGVEVTQAIPSKNKEAESLYVRLQYEKDKRIRERLIDRIEQVGGRVSEWGLFGPNGTDSFDLVEEAFLSKLDKLNGGGYRLFAHNHLFILSDILANNTMLTDALAKFLSHNSRKTVFERVIVSVPGRNYDFNLAQRSFSVHPFSSSEQFIIAEKARLIAIAATQNYAAK